MTPPPSGTETPSFRRLWPAERHLYEAHLRRLDPESRRLRFGIAADDAALERLAQQTGPPNAIVHAAVLADVVRGVSEVRPISGAWPLTAEVALSVERGFRRRGLARALMARAVTTARNRGLSRLVLLCAEENIAVRRLARSFGAALEHQSGEVEGRLATPAANMFSMLGEWFDDALSFNRYVLDL